MSDPIVTHADLPDLERLSRRLTATFGDQEPLLDRLIAVAKADSPPLPEDWMLAEHADGTHRVLWHKDGTLWLNDDCTGASFSVEWFVTVTPLRPTVTEADVERAAEAAWRALGHLSGESWVHVATVDQRRRKRVAAGIEVQP